MALVFTDRVPQQPGRVKITPEQGTTYYATVERADDPLVIGTPLNAKNLNDMIAMIQSVDLNASVE